jgi:TrmH family RNA methyltransferase
MSPSPFDRALDLTRPAGRRASGHFLAEGPHVVAEAIEARASVKAVFAAHEAESDEEMAAILQRAHRVGADVHVVPARDLAKLADTRTPQGLIAVVALPDVPADPFAAPGPWLLLDEIQDPGNVGTLLRSAEAFGALGVVAGPGTADLWSGKVLRSAQGAHFRLVLLDGDVAPHLDAFERAGGELWAATRDGGSVYDVPAPPARVMLALGNEARGLADDVLARARRRVSVPQRGRAESLNVAMAGSVLLSWLSARSGGARR